MKTAIIVGGGMGGVTAAYLLSKKGWKVRVFEANNFLGGGCRTLNCGIHPYTIGPRPIYTEHEEVFAYLSEFAKMEKFDLLLQTFVAEDDQFYSYPIHEDDISLMPDKVAIDNELNNRSKIHENMNFEEYYTASLGNILYEKFINNYSKKMWGVKSNTELTDFNWSLKGAPLKKGSRIVREGEIIHAHPINRDGYNNYFDMIYDMAEVNLNILIEDFDAVNKKIKVKDEWIQGDILISTASVDSLMNYRFGELRYIGRKFIPLVLPVSQVIPDPITYLYYAGNEPHTRIVEYKKLYRYDSPFTLIGIEIPSFGNKMYPYPIKSEREKAKQYLDNIPENVFSVGRLGRYKYDNIGEVIFQVKDIVENL